jgi:hypothetical protein
MANFLLDTFTEAGPGLVQLNNHTSDSGHAWSVEGSNVALVIDSAANNLTTNGVVNIYALSGATPPSADYTVEQDITINTTSNFTSCGVLARASVSNSGYLFEVDPNEGTVALFQRTSGSNTSLGSASLNVLTLPVTYNVKIEVSGSSITGFINGVAVVGPITNTVHTAAGLVGLRVRPVGSRDDNADYDIDNFSANTLAAAGPDYTQRKGSTFTANHTLGTITTATLNAVNVFDHVSSQAAGTISFTGSVTDERTTSGVVDLVLGDGAATQTQTVQVNVFGVVPSNNPAQKDGAALASLTGVQIRVTAGANLNGTQVYYSPTQTTDASGNFNTLDVSTSAAVAADPVRMQVLTAAGDSITSAETVGLI